MPPVDLSVWTTLQRRWLGLIIRGSAFALVFACGLAGFTLGAEISERSGVAAAGSLTRVYYTLGLFVLGGLDLGLPTGEGPMLAKVLLWFAYFSAPAITASALNEGVFRILRSDRWRLGRLRNHIVVGGCGRLALLYIRRLRDVKPNKPLCIVEIQPNHPDAVAARELYGAHVVTGDISRGSVLDSIAVTHADRILLFTGDDFANLDAAAKILARDRALGKRIVVHVADIGFMRGIAGTRVANECTVINTHQAAAKNLVETTLLPRFRDTAEPDLVVLAGFGRFGQSILDELQKRALDCFDTVVILDLDATTRALVFDEQVGFSSGYKRNIVDADLRDPSTWRFIADTHDFAKRAPVFILGSGDDGTNLRTALTLTARYPESFVVARSFVRSSFAEEVSVESGFYSFSVADLVRRSFPRSWFGSERAWTMRFPTSHGRQRRHDSTASD